MKNERKSLIDIRKKIQEDGTGYTTKDIDLFADKEEIEDADKCMFWLQYSFDSSVKSKENS